MKNYTRMNGLSPLLNFYMETRESNDVGSDGHKIYNAHLYRSRKASCVSRLPSRGITPHYTRCFIPSCSKVPQHELNTILTQCHCLDTCTQDIILSRVKRDDVNIAKVDCGIVALRSLTHMMQCSLLLQCWIHLLGCKKGSF